MESTSPKKRRGRAGAIAAGVLLALVFAFVALWIRGAMMPLVLIPARTPLNPNAFDLYVRAGENVVRPKEVEAASQTPRPGRPAPTLAEKTALVAANQQSLGDLRAGFALPYEQPPLRSFVQQNRLFGTTSLLGNYRTLRYLLVLEAQVKEARGDLAGATNARLDAVRLGEDVPRGGGMLARLTGLAVGSAGRVPLWRMVNRLPGPVAKNAARRVETIAARHVPLADTLTEEKYMAQTTLLELLQDPTSLAQMAAASTGAPGPSPFARQAVQPLYGLYFVAHPKRQIVERATRYLDAQIAAARTPFAADPSPPLPPKPNDLFHFLLPDADAVANLRLRDANAGQAQNALLAIALALRAYRAERGRYPVRLADLVSAGYLERVPADPFARAPFGAPLAYKPAKKDGNGYVLYSVGPDGKDDGGTPIDAQPGAPPPAPANRDSKRFQRYFVERNSRGDIVAGVNRW